MISLYYALKIIIKHFPCGREGKIILCGDKFTVAVKGEENLPLFGNIFFILKDILGIIGLGKGNIPVAGKVLGIDLGSQ